MYCGLFRQDASSFQIRTSSHQTQHPSNFKSLGEGVIKIFRCDGQAATIESRDVFLEKYSTNGLKLISLFSPYLVPYVLDC